MSSDLVLACRFDGCDAGINSYFGHRSSRLAVAPPVELMPAKLAHELTVGAYLYEPKWDGFRAIVFRGPPR
jgi:ATP-dependent DNA ligase